ncbi:MAG: hypothetical protein QXI95_00730, partial [Candidatus Micrarchaeaceae archaeon]
IMYKYILKYAYIIISLALYKKKLQNANRAEIICNDKLSLKNIINITKNIIILPNNNIMVKTNVGCRYS